MNKALKGTDIGGLKPKPPGNDIAISTVVIIWGILLSNFPNYVGIESIYGVWFFKILGIICYTFGFLGAVIGINNLTKPRAQYINDFLSNSLIGACIIVLAIGLHMFSLLQPDFLVLFILRLFVLILVALGLLLLGIGLSYLSYIPFEGINFETIMRAIVALFSLLAAIIPLINKLGIL